MENNNKESHKLLGMSGLSDSDSCSEVPEFVLAPSRKKRIKRRTRGTPGSSRTHHLALCNCKGSSIALTVAVVVLICWLVTLTWLAIVLHAELIRLDSSVRRVVAGSQGVPIALQQCHSLSKDLQQNQTALFNRLAALTVQFGNFSSQLTAVQYGLFAMEERLKASPELINVPQTLKDLSASVASFGSEVRDLNSTVTALKDQNNHLQDTSSQLVLNITSVKQSVMQLLNSSQPSQVPSKESAAEKEFVLDKIRQLSANVTHVNATLSSKLQWALDEQPNNRKLIDALRESDQNLSTRLTTMEGQFASQVPVLAIISNLTQQANSSQVQLSDVVSHVQRLQVDYEQLERNATQLASAMNDVRQVVTSLVPPQTNSAPNEETYDPETKPSSTLISTPSGT